MAAVRLADGALELIPTAARPQGSVLARDGSVLYVTNTGAARITVIDAARQAVRAEITTGKGAGRIGLTPDGRTLIYNLQEDQGVGFLDLASSRQNRLHFTRRPAALADLSAVTAGVRIQASRTRTRSSSSRVPERKLLRAFPTPKDAGPDPVIDLE